MKKQMGFVTTIVVLAFVFILGLKTEIEAAEITGKCGENATYTLDENTDTLVISGTGDIYDYGTSYIEDNHSPFFDTHGIRYVIIEDGITGIGAWTFYDCWGLIEITIPESVVSYGTGAFYNTGVEELAISKNTKVIEPGAFEYMCNLREAVIPAGIDEIPDYLFYASGIQRVSLPDSITRIGDGAFGITDLLEIDIPKNVKEIGFGAFESTMLKEVIIQEGVTRIERFTFEGTYLDKITLPSTLEYIGSRAFMYGRFASVYISGNVKNMGIEPFYGCKNLEEIHTDNLRGWCEMEYEMHKESNPLSSAHYLYLNDELITNLVIPEGTEYIADYAFHYCKNIESVVVPKSVEKIGKTAFFNCTNLERVEIYSDDCVFPDESAVFDEATTIYGNKDSTAEEYAKKYGYKFKLLIEESPLLPPPFMGLERSKDIITSKNAILNAKLYPAGILENEIKEFSIYLYQDGELVKSGKKVIESDFSNYFIYIQFDINKDLGFELIPNTEYSYIITYTTKEDDYCYRNGFWFTTPEFDETKTPAETTTANGSESVTTTNNKKFKVKRPAIVKIIRAKKIKKRSIGLKFTKTKNVKKYVVQYSTNRKFKKPITKKTKRTAYTIKKLKVGKTYYIRIRGVNKKYKGKWSNVKKVTIKK